MEALTFDIILLLLAVGIVAGFTDAIAGGGAIVTMPALLLLGLNPVETIATNKLQSSFGSGTAALSFIKMGKVNVKRLKIPIIFTAIGTCAGTISLQFVNMDILKNAIPFMLIGITLFFLFCPAKNFLPTEQRVSFSLYALMIAFPIGFYDGFFGPGTGSFYTIAFTLLIGYCLVEATAHAKVLNFTSNIVSLITFSFFGQIIWLYGIFMAIGQVIGSYFGTLVVVYKGTKVIRYFSISVSLIVTSYYLYNSENVILEKALSYFL